MRDARPSQTRFTRQCPVCDREDWDLAPKILANYDGCAGLNPAAYRTLVEESKTLLQTVKGWSEYPAYFEAWERALTRAEQEASR